MREWSPCIIDGIFSINRIQVYRVFKKSSPPLKLFGIFSLSLSFMREILVICWQFISTCICQFVYIYLNISSNGVNFSTSTRRFHGVRFRVLNWDTSWARTWWESHHFQWYPDNRWKLSTGRKVCSQSTTLVQPFCVNQAVGDLPQRLHAHVVCRCKTIFPLVCPTKL